MPARFNDKVSTEGMEQLSIYNFFTDWTGASYTYIDIQTDIPAPSSYIMGTIEAVGYSYAHARNIRCAWNFYTYYYDIGNVNNNGNYSGLSAYGYYSGGGYWCLKAVGYGGNINGYLSFTLNAYPTAGAGPGYPIGIRQVALNNTSGPYY